MSESDQMDIDDGEKVDDEETPKVDNEQTPKVDLDKAFYMHKELEIDLKQVEDFALEELTGLSMDTKLKVQIPVPTFTVTSLVGDPVMEQKEQVPSKIFTLSSLVKCAEKAVSDAANKVSMSGTLKEKKKKMKRLSLQERGKYSSIKIPKLNFSNCDGMDSDSDSNSSLGQ